MTLEEHIEAEKRVASFYLDACQTTREADEFGVYGKEAQMYEDKYYAHTERADLLEELKTLRKAYDLVAEDWANTYLDEEKQDIKDYYLKKAGEDNG